jgi:hypothetical protein
LQKGVGLLQCHCVIIIFFIVEPWPRFDWDEFQKIKGCQVGPHQPKGADDKVEFWKSNTVANAEAGIKNAPPPAPKQVPRTVQDHNREEEEKAALKAKTEAEAVMVQFLTKDGNPKCTNKGCNKEYKEGENSESACSFHPGAPVNFHFVNMCVDFP